MITHAKVDCDVIDDALGTILDGWRHVHVIDPQTSAPPTDGQGRMIVWIEINTAEGWGYIIDLDDDAEEERQLRVEAPWIRLLALELRLPGNPAADL